MSKLQLLYESSQKLSDSAQPSSQVAEGSRKDRELEFQIAGREVERVATVVVANASK